MDPDVIDPPDFDQEAAWKECRDYVDDCGGLSHEDGSPNWRAAFGADPGCCSCPACGETYWAWGRRQRCKKCGLEYPTDWWPMYSHGVQQAKHKGGFGRVTHERNMAHPAYRYGFENPVEDAWANRHKIDWRAVLAALALLLLPSPALAGHLTELGGERAVAFGGRTWTWEQLAEKRAEDPRAFDAILPKVGWMLADPGRATARRDLDPARFDRFHPCLGWLLGGREGPGVVAPGTPAPPVVVRPAAVPEPGSAFLAGAGVGLVLAYLIARRKR